MTFGAGGFLPDLLLRIRADASEAIAEVDRFQETLSRSGATGAERMHSLTTAVSGVGVAMAGIGIIGIETAGKLESAHVTLETAIEHTGHTYEEYGSAVKATDSKLEHLGFTNADVEEGLAKLTVVTGDASVATKISGDVADIARVKHLSFAEASRLVALAHEGNARALKELGVPLDATIIKHADLATKNLLLDEALGKVHDKIGGLADALHSTLHGRLDEVKADIVDHVALWGQKYGPALTIAGAATTTVAQGLPILGTAIKDTSGIAKTAVGAFATLTGVEGIGAIAGTAGIAVGGLALLAGGLYVAERASEASKTAWAAYDAEIERGSTTSEQKINAVKTALAGQVTQITAADLSMHGLVATHISASGQAQHLTDLLHGLEDQHRRNKEAVDALTPSIDRDSEAARKHADLITRVAEAHGISADKIAANVEKLDNMAHSLTTADENATRLKNDQETLNNNYDTASEKVKAYADAMDDMVTRSIRHHDAAITFNQDMLEMTDKILKNGITIDDNTLKGIANQKMIEGWVTDANKAAQQVMDLTGDHEKANAVWQTNTQRIEENLIKLGLNRDQVHQLLDVLGVYVAKDWNAHITQTGGEEVIAMLDDINNITLNPKDVKVSTSGTDTSGFFADNPRGNDHSGQTWAQAANAHAQGGVINAREIALLGEEGHTEVVLSKGHPENWSSILGAAGMLADLPGVISPAPKMPQMPLPAVVPMPAPAPSTVRGGASAEPAAQPLTIIVHLDGREVGRVVAPSVRDTLQRSNGRNDVAVSLR